MVTTDKSPYFIFITEEFQTFKYNVWCLWVQDSLDFSVSIEFQISGQPSAVWVSEGIAYFDFFWDRPIKLEWPHPIEAGVGISGRQSAGLKCLDQQLMFVTVVCPRFVNAGRGFLTRRMASFEMDILGCCFLDRCSFWCPNLNLKNISEHNNKITSK